MNKNPSGFLHLSSQKHHATILLTVHWSGLGHKTTAYLMRGSKKYSTAKNWFHLPKSKGNENRFGNSNSNVNALIYSLRKVTVSHWP